MKKIVLLLLMFFVIGLIGTAVTLKASGGLSFNTVDVHDEKVIEGSQINNIEVDLSSSDVKIIPTDDKDISVRLSGEVSKKYKDDYSLDVEQNGDSIVVKLNDNNQFNKWFNIGVTIINTRIEVELPKKVYESMNIDTSSGDIDFNSQQAKEITLNASTGDIIAEKSNAVNQFTIHTSSGDIKTDDNQSGNFIIDANSGDLFIKNQTAVETQLETSSGEINLRNVIGNIQTKASSGDTSIHNKELTGNIEANASSGDVTVRFDQDPTSMSIDFSGSSGEGKVNLDNINYQEKSEDRIIGEIGTGQYKLNVETSSGDFNLN